MSVPQSVSRRSFISRTAVGAAAAASAGATRLAASTAKTGGRGPVLMHAGHQHDHSENTLRALAAFGVKNICSGKLGKNLDDSWSVDGLTRLRKHVESFGIKLDAVPLPFSSNYITRSEHPEIMLAKD